MIVARQGSPLAVGYGDGEMFVGSDAIALAPFTDAIAYLEDGDWAVLTRRSVAVRGPDGRSAARRIARSSANALLVDKGNHRHFMGKEIHEQPDVINHTLAAYLDLAADRVDIPSLPFDFGRVGRLSLSACGTTFHACLVAKYWFERWARLPVDVDIASEFRYRESPLDPDDAAIFVSQSGETADTLAALRYCRERGQKIVSIVNVPDLNFAGVGCISADACRTRDGAASTKAFACQLAVLAPLAIAAGKARGTIGQELEADLVQAISEVPRHMSAILREERTCEAIAQTVSKAHDALYLGRGSSYPLALEGALKLKEISYIHAEGYAAGELKHGPIALVDENMPVIVVAPHDDLFGKTVSNMQEVSARGGQITLISDASLSSTGCTVANHLTMPAVHTFVAPIVYALPLQLIAYHTAIVLGKDVDQPRNLAKSVTVE